MHRVIRFLSLILAGLLGVDWTRTGIRYIHFYSGGSGFVVPVPGAVLLLFLCGLAMVAASILTMWFPRLGPALCITVLFVMAVGTIVQ